MVVVICYSVPINHGIVSQIPIKTRYEPRNTQRDGSTSSLASNNGNRRISGTYGLSEPPDKKIGTLINLSI